MKALLAVPRGRSRADACAAAARVLAPMMRQILGRL
jgi:hypothetical protein